MSSLSFAEKLPCWTDPKLAPDNGRWLPVQSAAIRRIEIEVTVDPFPVKLYTRYPASNWSTNLDALDQNTRWLVQIIPPPNDVRFREILHSIPYRAVQRAEGTLLVIPSLQEIDDPTDVVARAKWIVDLINFGIVLTLEPAHRITVGKIFELSFDGTLTSLILSDLIDVPVETFDPYLEDGREHNRVLRRSQYIRLMLENSTAPLTMQLAERASTPAVMYNILEGIWIDMGGSKKAGIEMIADEGWFPKTEIENLCHCLNHRDVTGIDSRHVFRSNAAPNRLLTLNEMENMVGHLHKRWLFWRASQYEHQRDAG